MNNSSFEFKLHKAQLCFSANEVSEWELKHTIVTIIEQQEEDKIHMHQALKIKADPGIN